MTEPAISHRVPSRSAQIFAYDVPKAAPKLAAAPGAPPGSDSKVPAAVPNTSISTTTLPTATAVLQSHSPIIDDPQRKKPKQLLSNDFNRQKFEVGKSASKAESLILRNIPEKFRMPEVLTISFPPQHLQQENRNWTARILISRL